MGKIIWLKDMGDEKMNKEISTVDEVSRYFLSKQSMTPKKLQKICYYSYAWYLTLYDEHLFDDGKFQAWVHGPVNPKLYDKYKGYGWREIPKKEAPNLSHELKDFLELIFNTFNEFDGNELENMTHNEEPWMEAREGLQPEEPSNNVIDDKTIKSFYSALMERNQVE